MLSDSTPRGTRVYFVGEDLSLDSGAFAYKDVYGWAHLVDVRTGRSIRPVHSSLCRLRPADAARLSSRSIAELEKRLASLRARISRSLGRRSVGRDVEAGLLSLETGTSDLAGLPRSRRTSRRLLGHEDVINRTG